MSLLVDIAIIFAAWLKLLFVADVASTAYRQFVTGSIED